MTQIFDMIRRPDSRQTTSPPAGSTTAIRRLEDVNGLRRSVSRGRDAANQASRSSDHRDRMLEASVRARAAEHGDHFVDAGADRAAGQGYTHRLRQLAELQAEAGEHLLEDRLHGAFGAVLIQCADALVERF